MVFISYYIISPPLQYLFAYTCGFNVSGLWAGQMIGSSFHLGSELYYIYWKSNWNKIALETHERIEKDKRMAAEAKEMGGPSTELQKIN